MFNTFQSLFKKTWPFCKNSYRIETSRLICVANQLTGFCKIRVFTEGSFRIVYATSGINFSYRQRLYVNLKVKQFRLVASPYFTDSFLHASLRIVFLYIF